MTDEVEKKQIEDRATAGDVAAQIYLGWAYGGYGPWKKDDSLAELWLRRAAASNDIEGKRRLCRWLYDHARNETKPTANDLVAAGDFYGYYVIAHLYLHGDCGVCRNRHLGLVHLQKAADLGHLVSALDLMRQESRWGLLNPLKLPRLLVLSSTILYLLLCHPRSLKVYR